MKSLNKILFFSVAVIILGLSACQKDLTTAGLSDITYYATFDFKGDEVVIIPLNGTYTEAGVTASEDGVDLPVTVSVSGEMTGYSGTTVPTNVADKYIISYSATNSDGYDAAAERIVWVSPNDNLTTGIAGLYTSTVSRGGATPTAAYTDMEYIVITSKGNGDYDISCAIGGYYYIGRAYGYSYAATGGNIHLNNLATNDFTYSQFVISGFGNTIDVTNMIVNATTGTITFTGTGNFANSIFYVTLTKVQF
jgi:hypothetical protein